MQNPLKIAIVGDFNFTYNSHHATNMALEHSELFLEVEISSYWIRLQEAVSLSHQNFNSYDGIWIAPGPFSNLFYLQGVLKTILETNLPVLLTGDALKDLLEVLAKLHAGLSSQHEKIVSDNLITGSVFETVEVSPLVENATKLYQNHSKTELTSCRYSIYPRLLESLNTVIEVIANNGHEDPEIMRLRGDRFCWGTFFCPQVSSTREMPHPIINHFIRACGNVPA